MTRKYSKVENHTDLVRDMTSGAVIRRDKTNYRRKMRAKKERMRKDNDINNLKNEVEELKSLVRELTDKNKNKE